MPRRPLDRDLVSNLTRDLDGRLRRWRPTAPVEDDSEFATKTMWLGDFNPVSDRHQPLEASPTESMVAYWASAETLGAAIPGPIDVDAPSAELVDLALDNNLPTKAYPITMIVALFAHYRHGRSRRLMVLLHLVTGTDRDSKVDVWSWRTALV